MKKVDILTIHFGVNHGSALQAFALAHYLNKLGTNCHLINYVPKRYGIWNGYYSEKKDKYPFLFLLGYFPVYLLKVLPNRIRFKKFVCKHIPVTSKYSTNLELVMNPPIADAYIVGSDQVWNNDYNGAQERSYYLNFVDDKNKKFAYAASFGKQYPLDYQESQTLMKELSSFKKISVREKDGIDILKDINISSCHVVDPVFLLTENEWIEEMGLKRCNDNYILVYVMDGIYKPLLDNAQVLSQKYHCEIHVVCFTTIKDKRISKCYVNCSPNQFVELVYNAQFVVTNSFHGTAFSTLFGKKMLIIGKEKYNSRMQSLLNKVGLSKRFFTNSMVISDEQAEMINSLDDIDQSKTALNNWIIESKLFLDEIIR